MSIRSQHRFQPRVSALECRTVPSVIPPGAVVLGSDQGAAPTVTVIDSATGEELAEFEPFEGSFTGGVSVAVGDVTGDDAADIVVAAAHDGGPRVSIIDGATGEVAESFFVFEPTFTGGVSVAVGDVNGDGADDIIAGAGTSGGPRVVAIDVATGNVLQNFFAFEPTFTGGVNVGSDDVNDDGVDDIVVGTGVGGAPRVTAFSGDDTGNVLLNFFAFRNGVNVSSADVDGDGNADVLVGAGTGGAPHVRVVAGDDGAELENFFAFDDSLRGGVRVAAVDTNGDDEADTLVAGTPGHLRRFFRDVNGSEIAEDINVLDVTHGVFVGGLTDGGHGKGHGNGNGHGKGHHGNGGGEDDDDDDDDGEAQARITAGTVVAVNPDLGTVTVRVGATDTLVIFTVEDDTQLVLDGEEVDDLSEFAADDVAVVGIGSDNHLTEITAATPGTGTPIDPPDDATVQGAVTAIDSDAGTVTVLTQDGTLLLVETQDSTTIERNNDDDATLADFQVGDFVQVETGADGVATEIEAAGATATST
jgi:hypothetical protein